MKEKAVQHLKNLNASKVLAIAFLAFCLYIGSAAAPQLVSNSRAALAEGKTFSQYIELINEQYHGMLSLETDQDALHNKSTYINFNGLLARLAGQREMNERYKLANGHLNWEVEPISEEVLAKTYRNILALNGHQAAAGKEFLFVLAPSQLYLQEERMPTGFTEEVFEITDRLTAALDESGVPYLDLSQAMEQAGFTNEEAFFTTDHHWKAETGFWAYGSILEKLAENGSIPPVDTAYTGPENFDFAVYEDAFLGSNGKRTGIYYAGVDDFCLITPKFDTELSVRIENTDIDLTGSFADVALQSDAAVLCAQKDYFNHSLYSIYGHSDRGLTHWRNENAPQQKKVMLIGDSFGNVPFSFMPLYFSSCEELDMRYFEGSFPAFYEEYDPDQVIFLISPLSFNTENAVYDYFPEAVS